MKSIRDSLTGGLALFVLDRLIESGRVKADEIRQLAASLPDEIRNLELRLKRLRDGEAGVATSAPSRPARAKRTERNRRAVRPAKKARAAGGKALGGMYGGLIRRVPKREQAEYVEIKNNRGIEAAIAALRARVRK